MSIGNKIKFVVGSAISGGDVLTSSTPEITPSISVIQKKEQGSKLINDLIKKEVTEEVKQLRYRMYWVESESNKHNFKWFKDSNGEINIDPTSYNNFTKPNVFEEDNKYLILCQNTEPISSGAEGVVIQKEGIKFVEYYPLTITRDNYFPKYKIEKYCKQIVLKKFDNNYQIDLYMNCIPSTEDRIERNLTFNLEKVLNKEQKIDNIDNPEIIEFTTKHINGTKCWGSEENIKYKLEIDKYIGITKYSSFYILHYLIKSIEYKDMIEQYYNENIVKEYDNKTLRPNTKTPIDIFTGIPNGTNDVEVCDVCGKTMEGLERADYRIIKSYNGRGMCKECYEKEYLITLEDNNNEIKPLLFRGTIK